MKWDYHFGVNKPYQEVEDGFVPALQDFYDNPDKYAIAPFQIFGNLWYVGDQKVTSHLIDTGDGLILFDTGYGHTTHMMLSSIRGAGFDPMDIKIIIHSHGHFDHFGSGEELRKLTGAKVYMSGVDTRLLREKEERALMSWGPCPEDPICWPDVLIEDGDHVKLGNTDIHCVLSAGHTAGTMTYFFDVTDGEKTLRAGYFGGTGMLGVYQEFCKKFQLPLDLCAQMKATIAKLRGYSVDIMLGNHPAQNRTLEKRAYMLETGENPFLDSGAWLEFLTALEERRQDFEDKGY